MSELTLAERCRQGDVLTDVTVIDCHCHMGPYHNFNIPEGGSPESMVHAMDLIGTTACVVSPHLCIGPGYREGNRQVMAAADKFPGRIIPYVTINPNYPLAEIEAEIAHWHDLGRIVAFKIHPQLHGASASHPGYAPVYEYAHAHVLPILSHSWAGDNLGGPAMLAALAAKYPKASFLIAHSASGWQMVDEACAAAHEQPRVYLDLTGSVLLRGLLEGVIERIGADRVLFGTDMPFIDPRAGLGRVLMSGLSDAEKRLVLGLNAKRLFGL
jgi:predicted TIM-barrel fold metal-dependent hydrolase